VAGATAPVQLVVVPPSAGLARSGETSSNTAGRRSLQRANRSHHQEIRTMGSTTETDRGPVLLCYDGSDTAKRALERAGHLLGGNEAVVLNVWESLGSAILRNLPSGETVFGREATGIAEDVVDELDASIAEAAQATAAEGAALAAAAGFDARPLARRALARAAERTTVTVWRAILDVANEQATSLIVLGSRGRSGVKSMVLGSVTYGAVHNSERPVLVVPPLP
jgi:nucleotide-binding universal stress UspA family protein